jgi:hypothetical protein
LLKKFIDLLLFDSIEFLIIVTQYLYRLSVLIENSILGRGNLALFIFEPREICFIAE